jgi:serine/threonine-protein kinase RsbW
LKTNDRHNKEYQLKVKSSTENLSEIRKFIQVHALEAGISDDVATDIILATDEACTNVIKHAYKNYPNGEIVIKVQYSDKKFKIIIIDHGSAFTPEIVPEPDIQKYYRQKRVGGLGMYLMKKLMDDVKYVSIPGKYNQVLMIKNLNSSI